MSMFYHCSSPILNKTPVVYQKQLYRHISVSQAIKIITNLCLKVPDIKLKLSLNQVNSLLQKMQEEIIILKSEMRINNQLQDCRFLKTNNIKNNQNMQNTLDSLQTYGISYLSYKQEKLAQQQVSQQQQKQTKTTTDMLQSLKINFELRQKEIFNQLKQYASKCEILQKTIQNLTSSLQEQKNKNCKKNLLNSKTIQHQIQNQRQQKDSKKVALQQKQKIKQYELLLFLKDQQLASLKTAKSDLENRLRSNDGNLKSRYFGWCTTSQLNATIS